MTPAGKAALQALRAIADPGTLAQVLAITADDCREAAAQCQAAWQDTGAGDDWRKLARALDSRRIADIAVKWAR